MASNMDMASTITYKSSDYLERFGSWGKVRDVLEGEERVKDLGIEYLPKPSGMDSIPYEAYKVRASFFDIADRTLRGLLGMVFRIEPTLVLPAKLEPLLDSATPDGGGLNLVVREGVRENTSMGRWGILVDMAAEPLVDGVPYLATYSATDIFNWEERMERGIRKLTRVVLKDNSASANEVKTTRILNLAIDGDGLYVMTVFEASEPENRTQVSATDPFADIINSGFELVETFEPMAHGKRLKEIPFWFCNTYDTRAATSKPPFLPLANMNLAHYRNSADFEHSLYLTSCPTPWISGVQKENTPKSIGSGVIWTMPKGGQAGMLEFSGKGIEAQSKAMEDKERRMAVLGARLIAEETRNVTAETTKLNARSETSVLTEAVTNVEATMISALRFAAEWSGGSPDDVSLDINRDYVETRMDPSELRELIAGWQMGAFSKTTLHENLQRGEIIDPQRTVDEEQDLIDDETEDRPSDTDDETKRALAEILANTRKREGGEDGAGGDDEGTGEGAGGSGPDDSGSGDDA